MGFLSLRNGFWIVLALAIVIDSSFDFIALRQTNVTDTTGNMVVRSYKIIDELNKVFQDFRSTQRQYEKKDFAAAEQDLLSLKNHVLNLQSMTADSPVQQAELQHLLPLAEPDNPQRVKKFIDREENHILDSLRRIRLNEENTLRSRLDSDQRQNEHARNQILYASIFDIFLLSFIAYIWVIDSRNRRRTEQTLGEAIQSISKANFDLEQASLSKTHLLKATAHDLRNPLGSIKGFAQMISEETNHASISEMSGIIQQVSLQTLELVNSLVDPNVLITGQLQNHFKKMDVVKCLNDICMSLKPQALQKNQLILAQHAQQNLEIEADSQKIWELFLNLISNAVKFSPKGGRIFIRSRGDHNMITVEVEDQGSGFSASDKEKAFQKFQRLSAQPTGGEISTGLGLALVKEIVESHHGKITIRDATSGKGACICVELPTQGLTANRFRDFDSPLS